ncbi:FAD binding domain-containing protein [Amycolatopsis palatopharyngis]|uniref:FAD binding domain-containing protein n=1 Tax=Amycolatopsis palatopharyngis TaxID=187982 RepID=UPI000E2230FC|nr:FAD binding domain-containing protein [Amycolatopsis palatopharyngis]
MKAAPFAYARPTSPLDVVAELAAAQTHGEAKIIAGGQSLMPVLAMRMGRPTTLVDVTRVEAWQQIEAGEHVRIGAAVPQRAVERRRDLRVPLLSRALPWIGHREIRSRGTVCGSLAHADPASELPAVALTLGARFCVRGPKGDKELAAGEFFRGAMTTALQPGEVLQYVDFPRARPGQGFGFAEIARRHGDFALVGITTMVESENGRVRRARIGAFGVADRPRVIDVTDAVAHLLSGELQRADVSRVADALTEAADSLVTTGGDRHASAAYRRRLVRVLGGRELIAAAQHSRKGTR